MSNPGSKTVFYKIILIFLGLGIIVASAMAVKRIGESMFLDRDITLGEPSNVPKFESDLYSKITKNQGQNINASELISNTNIDPLNQSLGRENPFAQ